MTERRWFSLNAGASNWLWLGVAVMALDQWTKWLIVERFDEFEPYVLLPVLEIMRLHNTGAAFSFLSNASGWQRCATWPCPTAARLRSGTRGWRARPCCRWPTLATAGRCSAGACGAPCAASGSICMRLINRAYAAGVF